MLFSDVAHRYGLAFVVHDYDPENVLAQEDSFSMVPKSTMPEIWEEGFGLIKPIVDWQVVLRFAAESPSTALCMLEWMGHGYTSYVEVV
jgi:hypothetical protein